MCPTPAHAQLIVILRRPPRHVPSRQPASHLMGLSAADVVLDYRDRINLKSYLSTGLRLATACRLRIKYVDQDGNDAILTINEKGNRRPHRCCSRRALPSPRSGNCSATTTPPPPRSTRSARVLPVSAPSTT